ncbi:MAG: response regulator [Acidobacteria bacterium]|nr:response regulator [Acidobacteriota bacterium]
MTYVSSLPASTPTVAPLFTEDDDNRILIVDDDNTVRAIFNSCLSQSYVCSTATSADAALEILRKESFALVLTDILMPGRSGVELLREIRTRYPETAVVVVSGVDRPQRVLDALRLGAYDYLLKPCELEVLEVTIARALERRELLHAARRYKQDLERRNAELQESKVVLERLQMQVIQSEKMASLGELAAGVAHELNNPAGFILGNMDILGECTASLERLLEFYSTRPLSTEEDAELCCIKREIDYEHTLQDLRSITADCREGAERIRDVVQNLRLFSRLDEAEFKKVDIHEGLESTLRLLSRHYNSGQITLRTDYSKLPLVGCFAGQLNQVWLNLLVNAAQSLKDGGEVCVTTWHKGEMVYVSISDSGGGIEPKYLKRIFDPFFTTKPVGEGTGLGLSVTYSIIERHGGTIEVESTVGRGTSFVIAIPVNTHVKTEDANPENSTD